MYWSVKVYSGWKFILFLVFGRMTFNFICLTFSTLRSSSLWRIGTIFLSLDKTVYRPGTTSPSSRNLALVGENSKLQPPRDKNLHSRNDNSIGKCPTSSWSWELLVNRRKMPTENSSYSFASCLVSCLHVSFRRLLASRFFYKCDDHEQQIQTHNSRAGQMMFPELLLF